MGWSRRQVMLLGLVGGPAAALAGLALRHEVDLGAWVSPRERAALRCLSLHEYATLKAAVGRIARGPQAHFPAPEAVDAALWAERYVADLPPPEREETRKLLRLLAHVLPLRHGSSRPFVALPAATQDALLAGMERSAIGLLRAGFAGLKGLAALGYFRDARTFAAIGYEGPVVGDAGDPAPRPAYGQRVPRARELDFDVDAVVVGAGAGGAMATREIARAGASVLLLEEGPDHPPESFTQREDTMLAALYADRGARTTRDRAIRVLQGRGLGGSTIHNQNLCKRAPDAVLAHWEGELGVAGWGVAGMEEYFSAVERELGVARIPDGDVNANNRALERGAARLGWRTDRLWHNREGCVRSGFCELGCAYDGKNNARKVVIPQAVRAGARVRAETRARRVRFERGRVVGVLAVDARTGQRVRVRARAVVLAASAVGSAALAIASGVPDPYRRHGAGLHLHPGGVVAGVFPRTIGGWRGIPQSVECTEHLDPSPGSDRRVWIVPGFAHPIGTATLLPGFGPSWLEGMRDYPRMAALVSMLHDESEGRVGERFGRPVIDYALRPADREQMARGLRACGELLLAAGAERVLVPFAPPVVARTTRQLAAITAAAIAPHALPLTAVHPMSTMRLGVDPRRSVCDPTGAHHRLAGLFVADGGLFPTSLGTPPQVSIYAAGMRVGRAVAAWLRRS